MAIAKPLGCGKGRNKRLGRDEVSDANRREDGAREGPDVEDTPLGIEALQRFQWLAFIAEFTIVIIFDNDGIFAPGPREQLEPAAECEDGPCRELMRGSDKSRARIRGEFAGDDAFVVYRDRGETHSRGEERVLCAAILRVFQRDSITAFKQDASGKINGLLGAIYDDDLRGTAHDSTRFTDVRGDGLLQVLIASGRTVIEMAKFGLALISKQNAPPGCEREALRVSPSIGEIVTQELWPALSGHAGDGILCVAAEAGKPQQGWRGVFSVVTKVQCG